MKPNILFYVLLIVISTAFTLQAQPQDLNTELEKAAITKVLEAETKCFFSRNYDCWKENWLQADYVFLAWNNGKGSYSAARGWAEVDKMIGDYIKDNPDYSHPEVIRKDFKFSFLSNDYAYLTYLQYNGDPTGTYFKKSQEVRLMQKVEGNWKIVQVSAFWDNHTQILPEEVKP